jgi:ssDNA-binding Zn-finger/Zn-ribbon topoisomerase 1
VNIQITVEFEFNRCWTCGRCRYTEKDAPRHTCPYCAQKHIEEAQREARDAELRARAARAAVTRMKNRGAK